MLVYLSKEDYLWITSHVNGSLIMREWASTLSVQCALISSFAILGKNSLL